MARAPAAVAVTLHGFIPTYRTEDRLPTGLQSSPDNSPWPMATIGRAEAETCKALLSGLSVRDIAVSRLWEDQAH